MSLAAIPYGAATAAEISAIGNEAPLWIAVSPDYVRSHMVAALSGAMGACTRDCTHLWVTRDGGATWHRHALPANSARLAIVADDAGNESVVTQTAGAVERSDNDGVTWHAVGPSGTPTGTPFDPSGLAVAVPGGVDYIATSRGRSDAAGSGGTLLDVAFALSGVPGSRHLSTLLAASDRRSGVPVVLRCDAHLSCAHPVPLGAVRQADDLSLLLGRNFGNGDGGLVVARTTTGLFGSSDGGGSFVPLVLPTRAPATYTTVAGVALGATPLRNVDVIYAALLQVVVRGKTASTTGGVYASADAGATWRPVGEGGPPSGGATAVAVAPDGRLFAGYLDEHGTAGLVCSEDGIAWRALCSADAGETCTACAHAIGIAAPPVAADSEHARSAHGRTATAAGRAAGPAARDAMTTQPSGGASGLVAVPVIAACTAAVVLVVMPRRWPLSRLRRRRR